MALEIDNLTLGLLGIFAFLLLYTRFSGITPLVHPLLLGKQSDVGQVRRKGETAVYRNWATGQGSPVGFLYCGLSRDVDTDRSAHGETCQRVPDGSRYRSTWTAEGRDPFPAVYPGRTCMS
jgi:hypothetical protein